MEEKKIKEIVPELDTTLLDILNEIVHNPNNNYSIIKKIFTQV